MRRVLLSWSSGKDSAWALHLLRQNPEYSVEALVTTFNTTADRVADAIVDGLARRAHTIWVPPQLRYVMAALRHMPRPLFRRLDL